MEKTIMDLTALTSVDRAADYFEIADASDSNASKRTNINSMLDLTSHPVGIDDIQTLTNKTLTSPTISSPVLSGTITGTYTLGGTPTLPASVVTLTGSQTLTNKTLTSPAINTATISNPTITVDSISEFTAANGVSIDSLNIKDGKLNTNNSVVTTNITDDAVTPAKLVAGSGTAWTWTSWTPTWTNLTVGNGTVNAKYVQTGKTVQGSIRFNLGSTSAVSGSVTFTLPVTSVALTSASGRQPIGQVWIIDPSAQAVFGGGTALDTTTTAIAYVMGAAGTYINRTVLSSTVPMTWTEGDELQINFFYEAA